MAERQYDLGDAELGALKTLWDHGPATVREVLSHLHDSGRRVAYTTVQTLLTRLEQKGYVTSNKSELAYVYRAKLTRDRVTRSRLKTLVNIHIVVLPILAWAFSKAICCWASIMVSARWIFVSSETWAVISAAGVPVSG